MDRHQVALIDSPGEQVPFVVAFRTIGRISLADAVEVRAEAMTRRGVVLVAGIGHDVAEHVPATFADQGIAVVVEPSAMTAPMVCRPQADIAGRLSTASVLVAIRNARARKDSRMRVSSTDEVEPVVGRRTWGRFGVGLATLSPGFGIAATGGSSGIAIDVFRGAGDATDLAIAGTALGLAGGGGAVRGNALND